MAYLNLIKIDGTDLPQPSHYVGTTETLVDGERNTEGVMIGLEVRADLGRVDADYNYISAADWSNILKLFSSRYGGSFRRNVTYFDLVANDWVTKEMYVGNRTTSGAYKLDANTGAITGYTGAKLALVEV